MPYTVAEIQLLIDDLKDNNRGAITPAKLRNVLSALFDFEVNFSPFSAAVPFAAGIVASAEQPQTVVFYNDGAYACVVSHITTSDFVSDNWALISPQGPPGDPGAPGDPATLPAGPWIKLATLTAAGSADLQDTTHFTSTYDEYEVVLENIVPAVDGANLKLELQIGGFWMIDGYSSLARVTNSAGSAVSYQTAYVDLSGAGSTRLKSAGGLGLSGYLRFFNPAETANVKRIVGQTGFGDHSDSGKSAVVDISAARTTTTDAVTGMRFYADNGNLATGKIHIFGRKK